MRALALGLTAFTSFGIVTYWTLVFAKIFSRCKSCIQLCQSTSWMSPRNVLALAYC